MGSLSVYELALDAAADLSLQMDATLFEAYSDGDTTSARLIRALHKTCRHLADALDWEIITAEHVFTSSPDEEQYNWRPANFLRFIPDTFWNRSGNIPLVGPLTPGDWQQYKTGYIIPSYPAYFIRQKRLYFASPPGGGQTISYEYITNEIGENVEGERIARFTSDNDVPLWDDELLTLGTIYYYRQIARMEHSTDRLNFDICLSNHFKTDGGIKIFDMGKGSADPTDMLIGGMKNRSIPVSVQPVGATPGPTGLTWFDYVGSVTYTGVEIATGGGTVMEASYDDVIIYRYVTDAQDAGGYPVEDAFYASFDGVTLSNQLAIR